MAFVCLYSLNMQAQRTVLLEQFTNSGCSICAQHDPFTYAYVANNSAQLTAISYHTSFPYFDSLYLENTVESSARTNFYGVVGVPYSIVDGNYYRNSTPNFNSAIATTVSNRAIQTPKYAISPIQNEYSGNQLSTSFAFQSLDAQNSNDSLRAFVVAIEEDVLKSAYAASPGNNSLTVYNYVMRKMLPNENGTFLQNRSLNGLDQLSFSWNMQHIKNKAEIRIVAFVQNMGTKEIYNAFITTPANVTSILQNSENNLLKLYPNPTSDILFISATSNSIPIVQLMNVLGKEIPVELKANGQTNQIDLSQLDKGIYILHITLEKNVYTRKICIE